MVKGVQKGVSMIENSRGWSEKDSLRKWQFSQDLRGDASSEAAAKLSGGVRNWKDGSSMANQRRVAWDKAQREGSASFELRSFSLSFPLISPSFSPFGSLRTDGPAPPIRCRPSSIYLRRLLYICGLPSLG